VLQVVLQIIVNAPVQLHVKAMEVVKLQLHVPLLQIALVQLPSVILLPQEELYANHVLMTHLMLFVYHPRNASKMEVVELLLLIAQLILTVVVLHLTAIQMLMVQRLVKLVVMMLLTLYVKLLTQSVRMMDLVGLLPLVLTMPVVQKIVHLTVTPQPLVELSVNHVLEILLYVQPLNNV
jgi:hypothetical protein